MSTLREQGKMDWTANNSIEHIKTGVLQRIADSLGKMAQPYVDLIERADRLDKDTTFLAELCDKKDRQIRGLRRAITRMKKRA